MARARPVKLFNTGKPSGKFAVNSLMITELASGVFPAQFLTAHVTRIHMFEHRHHHHWLKYHTWYTMYTVCNILDN